MQNTFSDFIQKGKVKKLRLIPNVTFVSSVAIMFLYLSSECIASESSKESHSDIDTEHEIKYNHAAVFVGGMSPVGSSDETYLALGLSYERRFNDVLGLDILADYTFGSHGRAVLFMTNLTYRPYREYGLKLMTGPGFEIAEHSSETEVNFVYGVGVAWEFHLHKVSITPTVRADFLGESNANITFGISTGTGF